MFRSWLGRIEVYYFRTKKGDGSDFLTLKKCRGTQCLLLGGPNQEHLEKGNRDPVRQIPGRCLSYSHGTVGIHKVANRPARGVAAGTEPAAVWNHFQYSCPVMVRVHTRPVRRRPDGCGLVRLDWPADLIAARARSESLLPHSDVTTHMHMSHAPNRALIIRRI